MAARACAQVVDCRTRRHAASAARASGFSDTTGADTLDSMGPESTIPASGISMTGFDGADAVREPTTMSVTPTETTIATNATLKTMSALNQKGFVVRDGSSESVPRSNGPAVLGTPEIGRAH